MASSAGPLMAGMGRKLPLGQPPHCMIGIRRCQPASILVIIVQPTTVIPGSSITGMERSSAGTAIPGTPKVVRRKYLVRGRDAAFAAELTVSAGAPANHFPTAPLLWLIPADARLVKPALAPLSKTARRPRSRAHAQAWACCVRCVSSRRETSVSANIGED